MSFHHAVGFPTIGTGIRCSSVGPSSGYPVGQDIRPETVVQNMIDTHLHERSFLFHQYFYRPLDEGQKSVPARGISLADD